MRAPGRSPVRGWLAVLVLAIGSIAACNRASQYGFREALNPPGTPVIGGELSAFGLSAARATGVSLYERRLLVRWETIQDVPVVTGMAEAWSSDEQDAYLTSGGSLLSLANQFVHQWAPTDAIYVADNRRGVGGTAIFAYRSETLRNAFEHVNSSRLESGDLYVVIVLDSTREDAEVPIAAPDFAGQANLEDAMFTMGLVLGQPWGGG